MSKPDSEVDELKEIINYTCEDSDIPSAAIRAMYHKIQALIHTKTVEAENRLYEGGEKKFVEMLLRRGKLEYSDSTPDDTVLIRVPKDILRKYFDGELQKAKETT